jgi:hypothetical protein
MVVETEEYWSLDMFQYHLPLFGVTYSRQWRIHRGGAAGATTPLMILFLH